MLNQLKKETSDRAKVNLWLDHIEEFDKATRDEVIEQCKNDKEARAYYVLRYEGDCKTEKVEPFKSL